MAVSAKANRASHTLKHAKAVIPKEKALGNNTLPLANATPTASPARLQRPRGTSAELHCPHFKACDGCSLSTSVDKPPLYHEASQFFAERSLQAFPSVLNAVHGWRCRAKLAVRGSAGKPRIGLFKEGSHDVVPIPDCAIHHPRINEAAELITQVRKAALLPGMHACVCACVGWPRSCCKSCG